MMDTQLKFITGTATAPSMFWDPSVRGIVMDPPADEWHLGWEVAELQVSGFKFRGRGSRSASQIPSVKAQKEPKVWS